jgi:hypothetical protein
MPNGGMMLFEMRSYLRKRENYNALTFRHGGMILFVMRSCLCKRES